MSENIPAISYRGFSLARTVKDGWEPLVTDLNLDILSGEVVALVGESGSGKSLSALACLGLLPERVRRSSGSLNLFGTDTSTFTERDWQGIRGTQVSMVFQDPMTSLDPCFTVGNQIVETIRAHRSIKKSQARARAIEIMDHVGIPDPQRRIDAYPHELSGGLRQRVMIAAALVMEPKLLIADEPTTALDVTTQASIVSLVARLQSESGMSVLWITHDLGVVASMANRVAVLYAGELVELAPTKQLFESPQHPYTMGLIKSAQVHSAGEPFDFIGGSVVEPGHWPVGCRFAPRCSRASSECGVHPAVVTSGDHLQVRCVHPGTLVRQ
jgi:oligopeptide/dipeptide ABC transporter ATP-binding protein